MNIGPIRISGIARRYRSVHWLGTLERIGLPRNVWLWRMFDHPPAGAMRVPGEMEKGKGKMEKGWACCDSASIQALFHFPFSLFPVFPSSLSEILNNPSQRTVEGPGDGLHDGGHLTGRDGVRHGDGLCHKEPDRRARERRGDYANDGGEAEAEPGETHTVTVGWTANPSGRFLLRCQDDFTELPARL